MKVRYVENCCFVITAKDGTKIITDPYHEGKSIRYGEIRESADIVTVSHGHPEHNNVEAIGGNPKIVMYTLGETKIGKINIKGIRAYHDQVKGREKGEVVLFCFDIDGLRLCHLGDLAHRLGEEYISKLGSIDILLIPLGGRSALGPVAAQAVCESVKPKIAIPMHFKTDRGGFSCAEVSEFANLMTNVKRLDGSELELTKENLPESTQVIILKPSAP